MYNTPKSLLLRSWLLAALGFNLFFVSCDEPGDVGLELQEEDGFLNSALIDTFTIEASTILDNREIFSQNNAILVAGAYSDPEFGDVSCATYFQVRLSEENKDFGSNAVCDSVKLFLDYYVTGSSDLEPHVYGDTSKALPLEVYKLTEEIDENQTYYTTSFVASESAPLGTAADYTPAPLADQELEVNLGCVYGQELLSSSNTNNDDFVKNIYGLKVAATDGTDASVIGFDATLDSSRVVLYYHNDSESNTFNYDINSDSRRFNHISGDRSASVLAGLIDAGDEMKSETLGNQVYMQTGTGLRVLLSFPTLKQFLEENSPLTISKAEIVMNVVDGTTTGLHDEAPVTLVAYEVDGTLIKRDASNNDILVVNDEFKVFENVNNITGRSNFILDEDEQQYVLPLTYYFEELAHGDRESVDLIVSPANNATRVTNAQLYDADTTINGDKALKLKLYYTKLE